MLRVGTPEVPALSGLLMEDDRFGTFPITNRGIQIWLFLRPTAGSDSVFSALLPCHSLPSGPPVTINLAFWESNYYRYPRSILHEGGRLQLSQIYLRYQGTSQYRDPAFEIDDSTITENGFTYSDTCPKGLTTGNVVTLRILDPLCVIHYSCRLEYHFTVGFGQCFGQNWIHVVCEQPNSPSSSLWSCYGQMLARAPEHAQSMKKAHFGAACYQVYILHTRLPRSTWILQTSYVTWKSSGVCGVK